MQPEWFAETLATLIERRELAPGMMRRVMEGLLAGRCGEAETAALLVALRMKGETAAELAEAATVLREKMTRFETGRDDVLDTCGTGGDGSSTFNISLPIEVVVLNCWVTETNEAPFASRISTILAKSASDRVSRSTLYTTTVSILLAWMSARSCWRAGRSRLPPE